MEALKKSLQKNEKSKPSAAAKTRRASGVKLRESRRSILPAQEDASVLREAVQDCRGCDLYKSCDAGCFG